MKGKILGASGDGGTISADDGSRYKFDLLQWNSDRPPTLGQHVDFMSEAAGIAVEVYPINSTDDLAQAGEKVKKLIGDGASSEAGSRLIALATGNAPFQISIGVLLASFLFTFLKVSAGFPGAMQVLPHFGQYTAFNISDLIDYLKAACNAVVTSAEQWKSVTGVSVAGTDISGMFGNPDAIANTFRTLSAITNLLYLVYLAPLGAVVTIVQAVRQRPVGVAAFATGIGCVVAFAAPIIWSMVIASAIKSTGNPNAGQIVTDSIHLGLGAYLILIGGGVLLAASFGFIRLPQKS